MLVKYTCFTVHDLRLMLLPHHLTQCLQSLPAQRIEFQVVTAVIWCDLVAVITDCVQRVVQVCSVLQWMR